MSIQERLEAHARYFEEHGEGPQRPVVVCMRQARAALDAKDAEIERLRGALEEFADCAMYDATMEGPRYKGWNISALNRALPRARSALPPILRDDDKPSEGAVKSCPTDTPNTAET